MNSAHKTLCAFQMNIPGLSLSAGRFSKIAWIDRGAPRTGCKWGFAGDSDGGGRGLFYECASVGACIDFDRGFSVCGPVAGKFNFSTKAAVDDDDEAGTATLPLISQPPLTAKI